MRLQKYLLRLRKLAHDVNGYLMSNDDFAFVEESLTSWLYPVDLEFTLLREDLYYSPRDKNGLPVRYYLSVGQQYNPTRIAAYALAHFNRFWKTHDEESRNQFFKAANWFMRPPDGLWKYTYPWLDLQPPWLSAMAQGEGISVLVRAWVLSGEENYLAQARRALEPFTRSLKDGGVRSILDDGSPFLEEYPTHEPSHVLNGFLFALIGLVDLWRISADEVTVVEMGAFFETLARHIEAWDAGFWSLYDLAYQKTGKYNLATVSYHNLHVTQLTYLGRIMDYAPLLRMADRWANDRRHLLHRLRAFLGKVRYRVEEPAQK